MNQHTTSPASRSTHRHALAPSRSPRGHQAAIVALAIFAVAGLGCDPVIPAPSEPKWQQLFAELPGALISIWGASTSDVWTVGGDPKDGSGPMVLHYDGSAWTRVTAPSEGDLWWVHGFAGGPVFMGGEGGKILRYEGGKLEAMTTPGDGTVFGLWGSAADDVWAVGGAGGTPTGGFVWHFDGSAWSEAAGVPAELSATATVFKVWGRAANDVWLVGTGGLVLHYDGAAYEARKTPTTRTLFTVHGDDQRTIAVGGFGTAVMLEEDGLGFTDVTPAAAPQMTGVFAHGGSAYAAGSLGSIMRRHDDGWRLEDTGIELHDDFHAVWIDPSGGVWCAGGQVAAFPLVRGMLLYKGETSISAGPYATN
ncbi:MAG: hypothetical protein EXR75_02400 [Myxococcales bacterium]|nr:hypothetical protein [Myxococcales bacterium]